MRAILAVLVAALCFATTGTAKALADTGASALSVGAGRIAVGGGLLALVVVLQRAPRGSAAPSSSATGLLARVPTAAVVALGSLGVLAYQPTFFAGTSSNGVAVGTVVALGSAPVATGALDALVRARRPEGRWYSATGLALVGLALVAGVADGGFGDVHAGIAWSIAAGVSYSLYAVAAKELLDRGWASNRAIGVLFGWAAAVAAVALVASGPSWLLTGRGVALVAWLGVVTTTVAYLLFGYGLRTLAASTVATLTLFEPLCATVLGVGVLDERLSAAASIGIVVLGTGLAVLTLRRRDAESGVPAAA
ncbi:DMT family transporter [Jatrophihabitans fulvus]